MAADLGTDLVGELVIIDAGIALVEHVGRRTYQTPTRAHQD